MDSPALGTELKRHPGRELYNHGSTKPAEWLLTSALIDELRLVIAPFVVGHGR
jgi:hypothetical protein